MRQSLRIGIVGVGKLGELHAKLLRELSLERKDIEFVGVFDCKETRCKDVARKYQVKPFTSLDALAAELDAAIIATTTAAHFETAQVLLSKGLHLFIEKPLTATLAEADALIALEQQKGVKIQVGHIERFNPALVAVEKYIGEPVFITAERLSGFSKRATDVSVVLDLMIHDIDLILSLVPSVVRQISATGVQVFSNQLDIANARIEFENGATATVTASRISRTRVRKMRFFCKNPQSYASLDLITGKSEVFRLLEEPSTRSATLKERAVQKTLALFGDLEDALQGKVLDFISPDVPKINALKEEQRSFIEAVLYGKPIRVSAQDGRRALEVATHITADIDEHLRRLRAT
ncbi:MAG: oxidoreductase [[Chlorobium] sp. 445]|nr:MAG: oxidoreductase [[Chlorobium] sp. 445]